MSVGSQSLFSQVFSNMLFEVDFSPFPETYIGDISVEEKEEVILTRLKEKQSSKSSRVCWHYY